MADLSQYSVEDAKSDLQGALHGTTLNQITGVDQVFNRAARQLLLELDPQETIRIETTSLIFAQVFDYPIPEDCKGNGIIDIRPQVNRGIRDVFGQRYAQDFDVNKQYAAAPNFTVNFDNATKNLRIDATNLIYPIIVTSADSVTGNGTWTAGGNASNLQQNLVNSVVPAGSSLSFDLAAGVPGSTGYLENSTLSPVDLSVYLNQAYEFLFAYLPTGANFTNVKLRFGSSSTAYYEQTFTEGWEQSGWLDGWNQPGGAWKDATVVGSPDPSSITYIRVTWTYDGTAQTGVGLNLIQSNLGQIFEILYYSKCLFRDATTGTFQERVTDDSNLINLDTETFNVFFNLLTYLTVEQAGGKNAGFDIAFYQNEYQKSLGRYQAIYKSQKSKPQTKYYALTYPGYQKYFNRGRF